MSMPQRPLPQWFEKELRFFKYYGLAWGYGYYLLAATGIIAPIVAWLLSGAPNGAPSPLQPSATHATAASLWTTVGLWSAIAAIATGLNSLLGAEARYVNAWEAYDYLFLAGIDYNVDQQLTEKFLRDALRTAHQIFARKQRPEAPSVSATQAPSVSATQAPSVSATQAPSVSATQAPSVSATQAPSVSAVDVRDDTAPPP